MTARAATDGHTRTSLMARLLYQPASPGMIIALSALPLLLAGWVLLSRDILRSDHNVLDLLFNLSGAWRFHSGQTQHVDFHEAVGLLNFRLTQAGFHLVGFSPFAFLVGQIIAALGLSAMAVAVAGRRLPLAAAVIFVLFVALLVLIPTNIGHTPGAFTFAMAYNRYGWSAIAVLCLLLFAPPRRSTPGDRVDILCGALLLLAMFYVKITYFLVGVGALALALLVIDHVRARRNAWILVGLLMVGNALAPHSHPYLADIHWAILSGLPRTGAWRLLVDGVLGNSFELSIYGAGLIVAVWLWRQGRASVGLPLAALFLIGASVMLFAQNTQESGLPLGVVILFMLYGALSSCRGPSGWMVPVVLLIVPTMMVLTSAAIFAGYFIRAVPSDKLLIATDTNARGIAVPLRTAGLPELRPQTIYFTSVLQAASLFSTGRHPPGKIQVVDRVNPLPFMLGLSPPRGGDLFWEPTSPFRPAAEVLGDADYVLVPTKFSTSPGLTRAAHERFSPYLAAHFVVREETEYWMLYARVGPMP